MNTANKRFWLLLKPDSKEIYQVYTYAFFKSVIALSLPLGIQSIVNLIQGGSISASWLVLVLIVSLGIAMGGYLQLMQMRITETIQQKIFTRAAFDFTNRLPKITFDAIYKFHAPELMNRFFDVITLQKCLSKIIIDFSTAILQIIFGLILLSLYHPFFILFSFLLVALVFAIIKLTINDGLSTSLEESKYKYKLVSWLEELAKVKDTFKVAGNTLLPEVKTNDRVAGYLNSRENHFQVLKKQYTLLIVFKVIVALGLLIVGGLLVIDQKMNIGQFIASEIIILLVIDSSEKLILNLENIYDILTSLEKLGQVTDLELENKIENSSLDHQFTEPFKIELNNISFTYPGRSTPILNNINLLFEPNKIYCITGKNGTGKSTLIRLISGLYHPQSGNICINNFPKHNYNLMLLNQYIGNGLSNEQIFDGTLIENISLGRDHINLEDVLWAIENVYLTDFVKSLPEGIDTNLENSSFKIQKSVIQKIILARSIVNKPKLLLLENQIESIETEEKNKIIDFLTNKNNGWTLIGVSNNPYFIEKSDSLIHINKEESN